jgi:DNA-binding transcriptional regulator LsrR (DeoR family)
MPEGERPAIDEEAVLAARAAWLYYAGSLTQSEIARRLEITLAKAHRLIARAAREGLVRVFVEGPSAGCIALEDRLSERHGLRFCRVVPDLGEKGLPLQALGRAAASFLQSVLERGEHRVIGVGHGRTLAAMVDNLPRGTHGAVCFVSLLGGLPRRTSANPFDVIHRLAERTAAAAYLLPVPFFADVAADREVLVRQRGVAEALALAAQASLFLVGIGEVAGDALLPASGIISGAEADAVLRAGGVGEVLGRFLDREGKEVATELHGRVIALAPAAMAGRDVVAVAGGPRKTEAIRAVLASGLVTALITDERTARRLVGSLPCRAATIGRGTDDE